MQTDISAEAVADSQGDEEVSDTRSAGEVLSDQRQRLGLNEKEVADQLHITMHYVKALESNSYEKLPGAVFAKGYLRSYAQLLGLDEEDINSRYDEFNSQQKATSEEASRLSKARRNKDRNKPLVIASLVVFVGGFIGLWVVNSYFGDSAISNSTPVTDGISEESSAPSVRQQAVTPIQVEDQLSIEVDSAEPDLAALSQTQTEAQIPDSTEIASIETSSAAPEQDASDDVGADLAAPELSAVLQALSGEASIAAETEDSRLITVESDGSDVLRLSFSGESWVEVNDSDSQQIYRDIRGAGDVLEITGTAPFNILLGDAPFTRLSLNGAEIDLSSDIRIDNSARLTVGL